MTEPTSLRVASAETVALTTTSAQSAAIGTAAADPNDWDVEVVRIVSTEDCWVKFAADPTAVAEADDNVLLPAGVVEYFDVAAGSKIAGILASGTANLNVARMR